MDAVDKILEETIPNYKERKNERLSNFSMLQNLAEEFFHYTNFQTTLFLEELKAEDANEFERYLANSTIVKLFIDINSGAFRENSFNYVWAFDDTPPSYYRFIHDDRHPLKVIKDKKELIRRLVEESTKIDLDKLEEDLNNLEQY
jgi:hypothetical protein